MFFSTLRKITVGVFVNQLIKKILALCRMKNKIDCPNWQAKGGWVEETSTKTYVVGAQKNRLTENICLN